MLGFCVVLLSVLTRVTLSDVIGLVGRNVTLPCRYDARKHGVLSFCWGRGEVPTSKCHDTILSSQDGALVFAESPRFRLLGREKEGDISLIILNAGPSDTGVYGCRVEVPGWFNDLKVNVRLVVEEAPTDEPVTQSLTAAGRDEQSGGQATQMTAAPWKVEVGDPVMERSGGLRVEGYFKASVEMGNVARMGAIFFTTIIIILAFIFRRTFQQKGRLQNGSTSAMDNIYECVHE